MKKVDPVIIGIIAITLVVIGGIAFVAARQQKTSIAQYSAQDADRPKLEIDQTQFDFGKIKLADTKIQEIKLKNSGAKPLVIYDFITSCDCTFAQLVISGKESPRFSMQRDPNWRGEVQPGETAVLKVIYEPKLMPVQGTVKREIVFKSNDPQKPQSNISFTAEVK